MNTNKLVMAAVSCVLALCANATSIVNGGFENGNMTGWNAAIPAVNYGSYQQGNFVPNASGPAGTISVAPLFNSSNSFNPAGSIYAPVAGTFFADLGTSSSGFFEYDPNALSPYVISVQQSIFLTAGETLSGWAAFVNGDYLAQDKGWVKVYDNSTGLEIANPWYACSGNQTNNGGNQAGGLALAGAGSGSPWQYWQWTAPTDSFYTIELAAVSAGDDEFDSHALFDNVTVCDATIPDSGGTLGLVGLSLAGLALFRRRWHVI